MKIFNPDNLLMWFCYLSSNMHLDLVSNIVYFLLLPACYMSPPIYFSLLLYSVNSISSVNRNFTA